MDEIQSVVMDSLADGVALVNADGTILRVNESFEVMFEAPRIRVVGRPLAEILASDPDRGVEVFDADGRCGPARRRSARTVPSLRPPAGRAGARHPPSRPAS